jgi:hypothetical protein
MIGAAAPGSRIFVPDAVGLGRGLSRRTRTREVAARLASVSRVVVLNADKWDGRA